MFGEAAMQWTFIALQPKLDIVDIWTCEYDLSHSI